MSILNCLHKFILLFIKTLQKRNSHFKNKASESKRGLMIATVTCDQLVTELEFGVR